MKYRRSIIEYIANEKVREGLTGKKDYKPYICQVFNKQNGDFVCILDGDSWEEVKNKYDKEYGKG